MQASALRAQWARTQRDKEAIRTASAAQLAQWQAQQQARKPVLSVRQANGQQLLLLYVSTVSQVRLQCSSEYRCIKCSAFELIHAGFYTPGTHSTVCFRCTRGRHTVGATATEPICPECPVGWYAPDTAMPDCLPCPKGSVGLNSSSAAGQ